MGIYVTKYTRKELEEKLDGINVDNKVDKETGKGLSTNDFTNEYKSILDDPWATPIN